MIDESMPGKIYNGKMSMRWKKESGKRGPSGGGRETSDNLRKYSIKDAGGNSEGCMKRLLAVDEVKEVCRDRSVWRSVFT